MASLKIGKRPKCAAAGSAFDHVLWEPKQTNKQTNKQIKQTNKQASKQTKKQASKQASKQTNKQTKTKQIKKQQAKTYRCKEVTLPCGSVALDQATSDAERLPLQKKEPRQKALGTVDGQNPLAAIRNRVPLKPPNPRAVVLTLQDGGIHGGRLCAVVRSLANFGFLLRTCGFLC